ncbi:MAG: hypothetical protein ACRDHZ_05905 [Ktedonobacteraceae bacterium]
MDEMKKKIRPIYSELRGYLAVAPDVQTVFDDMAVNLVNQLNGTIQELNVVAGKSYDKFKVNTFQDNWNGSYTTMIRSLEYRNKLSGLINNI